MSASGSNGSDNPPKRIPMISVSARSEFAARSVSDATASPTRELHLEAMSPRRCELFQVTPRTKSQRGTNTAVSAGTLFPLVTEHFALDQRIRRHILVSFVYVANERAKRGRSEPIFEGVELFLGPGWKVRQ